MRGTECDAVPPQRYPGMSRFVTGRPGFNSQMLQIEIFRQAPTFCLDL